VRYTSPVTQLVKPAPGTVGPTELNSAYSLWNLSGSTINYTAGNVGIGTASPTGRLNVVQNGTPVISQFDRTDAGTGLVIAADSSGPYFRPTTSSAIRWNNSGNTVEYMRIDSNGNVGIGITSPTASLQVYTTGSTGGQGTTNTYTVMQAQTSTNNSGLWFGGMSSETTAVIGTATGSGNLAFQTYNGSAWGERMRITSGGDLSIGTTVSNGQKLNVQANSGNATASFQSQGAVGVGGDLIYFYSLNRGSLVGYIGYNGSSVSYNTSSDYRLKENIAPMTGALSKVLQLKPVTYTWKETGKDGQGFVAHELAEICPDAVSGEKDAVNEDGTIMPQAIDTSFLVATLTAAIQEQQAIIENLKARIEVLEAK
jgi:hypothetical protein